MKTFFRFAVFCLMAGAAFAQSPCTLTSTLTTTGPGAAFDNRTGNCSQWTVSYTSTGFTSLLVQLEGAPDAAGTPGTFAPLIASSGTNPAYIIGTGQFTTAQLQNASCGLSPCGWLRYNLLSFTTPGSITLAGNAIVIPSEDISTLAINGADAGVAIPNTTGPIGYSAKVIYDGVQTAGNKHKLHDLSGHENNVWIQGGSSLTGTGVQFISAKNSIASIPNSALSKSALDTPELITNGCFSVNPCAGTTTTSAGSLTGWTVGGGAVTSTYFSGIGNGSGGTTPVLTGNSVALVNAGASITQANIPVIPGAIYNLSYWCAGTSPFSYSVLDASNSNAVIYTSVTGGSYAAFTMCSITGSMFKIPANTTLLTVVFNGVTGTNTDYVTLVSLRQVLPFTVTVGIRRDAPLAGGVRTYFAGDSFNNNATGTYTGPILPTMRWTWDYNDGTATPRFITNPNGVDGTNNFVDLGITPPVGEIHYYAVTVYPTPWIYQGQWVAPVYQMNIKGYYDGVYTGDLTALGGYSFTWIYADRQNQAIFSLGALPYVPYHYSDVTIYHAAVQNAYLTDADHAAAAGCFRVAAISRGLTIPASYATPANCPTGIKTPTGGMGVTVDASGAVSIGQDVSQYASPEWDGVQGVTAAYGFKSKTPPPVCTSGAGMKGVAGTTGDCNSGVAATSTWYAGYLNFAATGAPAAGGVILDLTTPTAAYNSIAACTWNMVNYGNSTNPQVQYYIRGPNDLQFYATTALTAGQVYYLYWNCAKN